MRTYVRRALYNSKFSLVNNFMRHTMTIQGFPGLKKALIVVCFVMSFGVLNANAAASAVDSLLSVVPETQETLSSQPDTLFTRNAEESVRVFFRFDNAVVRTDYLDNAESFSKIDSLVVNDFLEKAGQTVRILGTDLPQSFDSPCRGDGQMALRSLSRSQRTH